MGANKTPIVPVDAPQLQAPKTDADSYGIVPTEESLAAAGQLMKNNTDPAFDGPWGAKGWYLYVCWCAYIDHCTDTFDNNAHPTGIHIGTFAFANPTHPTAACVPPTWQPMAACGFTADLCPSLPSWRPRCSICTGMPQPASIRLRLAR